MVFSSWPKCAHLSPVGGSWLSLRSTPSSVDQAWCHSTKSPSFLVFRKLMSLHSKFQQDDLQAVQTLSRFLLLDWRLNTSRRFGFVSPLDDSSDFDSEASLFEDLSLANVQASVFDNDKISISSIDTPPDLAIGTDVPAAVLTLFQRHRGRGCAREQTLLATFLTLH